jgi:hypothetical protein
MPWFRSLGESPAATPPLRPCESDRLLSSPSWEGPAIEDRFATIPGRVGSALITFVDLFVLREMRHEFLRCDFLPMLPIRDRPGSSERPRLRLGRLLCWVLLESPDHSLAWHPPAIRPGLAPPKYWHNSFTPTEFVAVYWFDDEGSSSLRDSRAVKGKTDQELMKLLG